MDNGELFLLTLIFDRVTRNKKTIYFSETMKFLDLRPHHLVIWAQASIYELLFSVNSRSSIVNLFRSFVTLQTCWQFFRLEIFTITVSFVLPTQWHASIPSGEISQPSFTNIFKTFFFRTSPDTSGGMPTISRHSRLEYWAFAKHCVSKVDILANNNLFSEIKCFRQCNNKKSHL